MAGKMQQCSWTGCDRAAGAQSAERALCLEHFLEDSQRRVESILQALEAGSGERNLSPEVQSFLSQVVSQTTVLATETRLLGPLQRDTLIELSTKAAEIYRRIQRMPRIARRIACRARTSMLVKEIPELCFTVNVSQRGACLELRQTVKMGQTITLERVDLPGGFARAKVAWTKQLAEQKFAVGIEIADREDFWGLGGSPADGANRAGV
jgi:PilZ domain